MNYHFPVLSTTVLKAFDPQAGQIIFDCTLGHAGHTLEFLRRQATVYALEADPHNLAIALNRIKSHTLTKNFHPILGNFANLKTIFTTEKLPQPDFLFADLGLSLNQQSQSGYGFSFHDDASLDMRLNPKKQSLTAEEIVNTWDRDQLYQIFTKYAQEKLARPLAYEIVKKRQQQPFKNAAQLAQVISDYYQKKHYRSRLHPATKIFLALRIAVNHEFDNLESLLNHSLTIVKKGGMVGIISFHSGEDRLVKKFILKHKLSSQKYLPDHQECLSNPPSRSAVFRTYLIP